MTAHARSTPRFVLRALLLFTILWAGVTYPQVLRMHAGVNDAGDPLLNTWALAWVAHQLPFAPAHVFDGNIFHPERRTLAYSETLLAPAIVGAPLLWLGTGPILVYNPAVVFEVPINRKDTRFMYYSTFHWQSLVNGYSGFHSPRYARLDQQLRHFPAHDALHELARLQVRYFVIHGEMMAPEQYRELTAALDALEPQVRLVSRRQWQGSEISLYRFSFLAKE